MKSFTTWTLFLAILALLPIPAPANAAEQVATVVAARGLVQALDVNGNSRKLAVRNPVFAEDTIETGASGRVQIMFTDNTLVSLGTATTMKIAEYSWRQGQNDGALKTRIKEGTFRVMGGALSRTAPQNFKTETPTATIGIRGSMYAGVATADSLFVVFQGGKGIEVTNAFGSVLITKPGYGTKTALGKPPLPAVKFSAREMEDLNKSLNGNGSGENLEKESDTTTPAPDNEQEEGASREDEESLVTTAEAEPLPKTETLPEADADPTISDPATETATVAGQLTAVVTDSSQTTLTTDVDNTASTIDTGGTSTALSGNFRIFLRDIDLTQPEPVFFDSTFLDYEAGTVAATILDSGELSGTLASGDTFGPYLISGYDPTLTSYSGFLTSEDSISYLDPTLGPLSLTATTHADPSGQFFYNTFYDVIDSTTDYLIGRLIYAGAPSPAIPGEGIDTFTGLVMHNSISSIYYDADLEPTSISISYYNRRIIGRIPETDPLAGKSDGPIFFGTINGDGSADFAIISSGSPFDNSEIVASYGTATGNLFGNSNQGLGFTATGTDYSIFAGSQAGTWEATGASFRDPVTRYDSNYPTTSLTYTGYVVGVADDTSTGAASRIFMNSAPGDVSMSIDPNTGVIAGNIDADELTSAGYITLSGLTVGGTAATSAYIANDDLVATLSGSNLALADYGNLLYTDGPRTLPITGTANDFLTWGYWEMAYTDPLDGSQDHLFSSQSFFIAGQQTAPAYLDTIMNTSFTGTYTGKAYGVQLDYAGQYAMPLTNGSTNLTVNFQDPSLNDAVTGSIRFDQATMTVNSDPGSLNSNGFTAFVSSVSGLTPMTSAVNGAFYGPAAEAVGGNFNARLSTGESYLGIFGGSR